MTFEKWDLEIVKEEEGADGDNHDQTSLSGQEMSKFVCVCAFNSQYKDILSMSQHIY